MKRSGQEATPAVDRVDPPWEAATQHLDGGRDQLVGVPYGRHVVLLLLCGVGVLAPRQQQVDQEFALGEVEDGLRDREAESSA